MFKHLTLVEQGLTERDVVTFATRFILEYPSTEPVDPCLVYSLYSQVRGNA
jgi:hypothetical protein